MADVFVIADLCSNVFPFGEIRLARMIEEAALNGAAAVKVQVFTRSHFPETERDSKRQYEFPRDMLPWFVFRAHASNLKAGASVFDEHAVDACMDADCDFLKIATREAYNLPLVMLALETGLPVYTSFPWPDPLLRRTANEVPLICLAQYPAIHWPIFAGLPNGNAWGWSSHTPHYHDVLAAIDAGATIIEKHLALSPQDPEAAWSLLPQQFREMSNAIKAT